MLCACPCVMYHLCLFLWAGTKLVKLRSSFRISYYEFTDWVLVGSFVGLILDDANTILGKELLVIWIGCVFTTLPLVETLKDVGCIVVATWFSLFISSCQPGTFLAVICLLACLVKWSDLINRRPHKGQANRFSPVWVRLCLASSSDLAKRLSQFSQVQGNGFSPKIAKVSKINLLVNKHNSLISWELRTKVWMTKNFNNANYDILQLKFNTKLTCYITS